eukprot:3397637-Pleurochrysis_carterae.AAC.1
MYTFINKLRYTKTVKVSGIDQNTVFRILELEAIDGTMALVRDGSTSCVLRRTYQVVCVPLPGDITTINNTNHYCPRALRLGVAQWDKQRFIIAKIWHYDLIHHSHRHLIYVLITGMPRRH